MIVVVYYKGNMESLQELGQTVIPGLTKITFIVVDLLKLFLLMFYLRTVVIIRNKLQRTFFFICDV